MYEIFFSMDLRRLGLCCDLDEAGQYLKLQQEIQATFQPKIVDN